MTSQQELVPTMVDAELTLRESIKLRTKSISKLNLNSRLSPELFMPRSRHSEIAFVARTNQRR